MLPATWMQCDRVASDRDQLFAFEHCERLPASAPDREARAEATTSLVVLKHLALNVVEDALRTGEMDCAQPLAIEL